MGMISNVGKSGYMGMKWCLVMMLLVMGVSNSTLSAAERFDLEIQSWRFLMDESKKLTEKEVANLPAKEWCAIGVGDFWQNQGFPNKPGQKRPLVGWYRCDFKLPKALADEELILNIGAIDDLDTTYFNGRLIGETGLETTGYWSAARVYPIPADLVKKDAVNTLLIRVVDNRGNGGLYLPPFEIASKRSMPSTEEKENPLGFRMTTVDFKVTYATAEDANNAKLVKLPLPDGKEWGFTTRWDDNSKKNFRMHELMSKYGIKGGFYLYSNYRFNPKGMNYGREPAKKLASNGSIVGTHSMTHPPMPNLTLNEMFYEAAAIRVEREQDLDTPTPSFIFPGGAFRNVLVPDAWQNIGKTLFRCGYHHGGYPHFINKNHGISPKAVSSIQPIYPGDKKAPPQKFEKYLKYIMKNPKNKERDPLICWGVHVWMDEEGWKNAEVIAKKYSNRPQWWYCNPNEYAAYRYQFHHAKLKKVATKGKTVSYRMTLPWAADTGDNIPLCLKVEHAKVESVGGGNDLVSMKTLAGVGQMISISQPAETGIPVLIDAVQNMTNSQEQALTAMKKFPGLSGRMTYDSASRQLKLTLKNNGPEALRNVYLSFWVPLKYATPERIEIGELKAGQTLTRDIALKVEHKSAKYNNGKAYFVTQFDFLYKNKPARCFLTVREKSSKQLSNSLRDNALAKVFVTAEEKATVNLASLSKPETKVKMMTTSDLSGWFKASADADRWNELMVNVIPKLGPWRKQWYRKVITKPYDAAVMINFTLPEDDMLALKGKYVNAWFNGEKLSERGSLKGRKGRNRLILTFKFRPHRGLCMIKLQARQGQINYLAAKEF